MGIDLIFSVFGAKAKRRQTFDGFFNRLKIIGLTVKAKFSSPFTCFHLLARKMPFFKKVKAKNQFKNMIYRDL